MEGLTILQTIAQLQLPSQTATVPVQSKGRAGYFDGEKEISSVQYVLAFIRDYSWDTSALRARFGPGVSFEDLQATMLETCAFASQQYLRKNGMNNSGEFVPWKSFLWGQIKHALRDMSRRGKMWEAYGERETVEEAVEHGFSPEDAARNIYNILEEENDRCVFYESCLTKQQEKIVEMGYDGFKQREIAHNLCISEVDVCRELKKIRAIFREYCMTYNLHWQNYIATMDKRRAMERG